MSRLPSKAFIFVAVLVLAGFAAFFALRRTPACSGDGKFMATVGECRAWGVDEAVCKGAVDAARAAAAKAAPKSATMFECEVRFSDCFEAPEGGFVPRPSFCLKSTDKGAQPTQMRYLEYVSDRMNRKKTREIPFD